MLLEDAATNRLCCNTAVEPELEKMLLFLYLHSEDIGYVPN